MKRVPREHTTTPLQLVIIMILIMLSAVLTTWALLKQRAKYREYQESIENTMEK